MVFNNPDPRGKIIVADDKYMNIQALKDCLIELKYIDRVLFRSNGQEAVDLAKEIVQKALSDNLLARSKVLRPISALLLDF